jgi:hypothetical protein
MSLSRSDQARINGAKSRGPKTPEGKARSSLNALKHGRYATNAIVLSNEDTEAFEDLVANYVRRIQPADPVEYRLTRELAATDWRLTRIFATDTRMLDHEMDIQLPALNSAGLSVGELTRLLNASHSIVDRSKLPAYLARREAQLIRARQSILGFLKDLRKNFPPSDSAPEVVPPQPLNPELPLLNESGTNPTQNGPKRVSAGAEEALLRRVVPPGPTLDVATSDSNSGQTDPSRIQAGKAISGANLEDAAPASALETLASGFTSEAVNGDRHAKGERPIFPEAARPEAFRHALTQPPAEPPVGNPGTANLPIGLHSPVRSEPVGSDSNPASNSPLPTPLRNAVRSNSPLPVKVLSIPIPIPSCGPN